MSEKQPSGVFFSGLVTGAVLGIGAYFFLTSTKEGKEISRKLKSKGNQTLADLGDLVEDLEDKGEELCHQAQETREKVKERVEQISGDFDKKEIEKIQARGRQMATRFFTRKGKTVPRH